MKTVNGLVKAVSAFKNAVSHLRTSLEFNLFVKVETFWTCRIKKGHRGVVGGRVGPRWEMAGSSSRSTLGSWVTQPPNPRSPPPAAGQGPIHSNDAAL